MMLVFLGQFFVFLLPFSKEESLSSLLTEMCKIIHVYLCVCSVLFTSIAINDFMISILFY